MNLLCLKRKKGRKTPLNRVVSKSFHEAILPFKELSVNVERYFKTLLASSKTLSQKPTTFAKSSFKGC